MANFEAFRYNFLLSTNLEIGRSDMVYTIFVILYIIFFSTPGINIPPPNGNQGQQPVTQPPPPPPKEISCTARFPADYCPQRSGNGICNPVSCN